MNGTQRHGPRDGDGGGMASMGGGVSGLGAEDSFSSQPHAERRPGASRSFTDLLSELSRGMVALVRDEMELAKTEMTEKAERTAKDVAFIGVGAAVGFAGALYLLAAAVAALAIVLPVWLSCLIVGFVVAFTGSILALVGLKRLRNRDMVPRETIETLKEQEEWLKERMT